MRSRTYKISRAEQRARKAQIIADFSSGMTRSDLAAKYGLGKVHIRGIVREYLYGPPIRKPEADAHSCLLYLERDIAIAQRYSMIAA